MLAYNPCNRHRANFEETGPHDRREGTKREIERGIDSDDSRHGHETADCKCHLLGSDLKSSRSAASPSTAPSSARGCMKDALGGAHAVQGLPTPLR